MTETTIREIPLELLDLHSNNYRAELGNLEPLAESIRAYGVIAPILVAPDGERFRVIAGRRRLEASRRAGLSTIPAIVRELPADTATAASFIENALRKDFAPLEKARAYQRALKARGWSQAELARSIMATPSSVANSLRLLRAPKALREALARGRITEAHALVVLRAGSDAAVAERLLRAAEAGSVAAVRSLADELLPDVERKSRRGRPRKSPPPSEPKRKHARAKPAARLVKLSLLAQLTRAYGTDDFREAILEAIRLKRSRARRRA